MRILSDGTGATGTAVGTGVAGTTGGTCAVGGSGGTGAAVGLTAVPKRVDSLEFKLESKARAPPECVGSLESKAGALFEY